MRKIKNTNAGGLGHYIGSGDGVEHLFFAGGAITEVDDKKLAEACKDPIVKSWFEAGLLVDQTVPVGSPAAPAPKGDEDKGSKK